MLGAVGVARMSHVYRTSPADPPGQPDDTDDDRSARHEVRRLALERVPPTDYPAPDAAGQGRAGMLT